MDNTPPRSSDVSTTKVRLDLVVEFDVDAWKLTFGASQRDVHRDVLVYVRSLIDNSAAGDECGLRVTDAKAVKVVRTVTPLAASTPLSEQQG